MQMCLEQLMQSNCKEKAKNTDNRNNKKVQRIRLRQLTILRICSSIDGTWLPSQNADAHKHQNPPPNLHHLSHSLPLRHFPCLSSKPPTKEKTNIKVSPFLFSRIFLLLLFFFPRQNLLTFQFRHAQAKLAGTICQKNPKPQKSFCIFTSLFICLIIFPLWFYFLFFLQENTLFLGWCVSLSACI